VLNMLISVNKIKKGKVNVKRAVLLPPAGRCHGARARAFDSQREIG
jgi:hypothetical protein